MSQSLETYIIIMVIIITTTILPLLLLLSFKWFKLKKCCSLKDCLQHILVMCCKQHTARYGTARFGSGRFAFPPQFSTALEWAGLFTCRYSCVASHINVPQTNTQLRSISTECVLQSRHMDVFNSNGEVYENACDLPPAAETVETVHGL